MPEVQAASWIEKTPGIHGGAPCIRKTRRGPGGMAEVGGVGRRDPGISSRPDPVRSGNGLGVL